MIDFLFNPQGRISRRGYVVAFLLPWLGLTQVLPVLVAGTPLAGILAIVAVFYLWPSLVAVPVKRFHDMGLTGRYQAGIIALMLLAASIVWQELLRLSDGMSPEDTATVFADQQDVFEFIAQSDRGLLGIALLMGVHLASIALMSLVRGEPKDNRYGNNPLVSGRGFAD